MFVPKSKQRRSSSVPNLLSAVSLDFTSKDKKELSFTSSSAETPTDNSQNEKQQEGEWKPTPMQKAFKSLAVQSQVDQFKAATDAMLERTQNTMDYYRGGGGITGAPVKGKMAVNSESGALEQTYLTPTGTATTNKAEAEHETRAYNEYVDNMTVTGQLRRAERDLKYLTDKANKRRGEIEAIIRDKQREKEKSQGFLSRIYQGIKNGDGMVMPSNSFTEEVNSMLMTDREYRSLQSARRDAQLRLRTIQHEFDRGQGKDVGFWRGFGEIVSDSRTWDFGLGDLQDSITKQAISNKSYDKLSTEESQVLRQGYERQAAEADYGQNESFWYRAGVMTGEMLPFMIDFVLMGGSKSGASAVTRTIDAALLKSLRSAVPKAARNKAVQWTVKALGAIPEDLLYRAPLMTNTVQGMKTASDIIDRKLGDVVVREDGT